MAMEERKPRVDRKRKAVDDPQEDAELSMKRGKPDQLDLWSVEDVIAYLKDEKFDESVCAVFKGKGEII